jgi:hypothetical protein
MCLTSGPKILSRRSARQGLVPDELSAAHAVHLPVLRVHRQGAGAQVHGEPQALRAPTGADRLQRVPGVVQHVALLRGTSQITKSLDTI